MTKTNAVGWFDIYVENMDRAVLFYETVFKQKLEEIIDPTGESKIMAFPTDMETYGAGGALVKASYARPSSGGTIVYFSVNDCLEQEELISHADGKIIRSKFSIGEHGYITLCEDTEGNVFGLHSMK
jgi:predicted enzyme related to lactoylglutathione lyase